MYVDFKLLYVGRIRIEKGIYSLADLIRNKRDIALTVIGAEKETSYKINQSNIKILSNQNNKLFFKRKHNNFYEDLSRNIKIMELKDSSKVIADYALKLLRR